MRRSILFTALLLTISACYSSTREEVYRYPGGWWGDLMGAERNCGALRLEHNREKIGLMNLKNFSVSYRLIYQPGWWDEARVITRWSVTDGGVLPVYAPLRESLTRETIQSEGAQQEGTMAQVLYLDPARFDRNEFTHITDCLRTFQNEQTKAALTFAGGSSKDAPRKELVPVVSETVYASYDSAHLRFRKPRPPDSPNETFLELEPNGVLGMATRGETAFSDSLVGRYDGRTLELRAGAFPRSELEEYRDEQGRTIFELLNVPVRFE